MIVHLEDRYLTNGMIETQNFSKKIRVFKAVFTFTLHITKLNFNKKFSNFKFFKDMLKRLLWKKKEFGLEDLVN